MKAQGKERSLLRDLALIYITLAHGADQDLSRVEVEAISRRLKAWKTQVTEETVLSAIKDALEDYTEDSVRSEVEAAVRRVRDEVDPDLRREIVDDLTEIAISDDKFLHEEGAFIGDLARAWGVHVGAVERDDTPWSVLRGAAGDAESGRSDWTSLHDLAIVYLHVAHRTDADLDEHEVDVIARLLSGWMPDVAEDRAMEVVEEVMPAYVQGPDRRLFEDCLASLESAIPGHQREAILADLRQIAEADGRLLPEERDVIRKIAAAWGAE